MSILLKADNAWDVLHQGNSARMESSTPGNYSVGDKVIAKNLNPHDHIRLPQYVRGRRGTVVRDQGVFIFPDKHAQGIKEPQRLYCVRFECEELWGEESPHAVFIDLFESYLEGVRSEE